MNMILDKIAFKKWEEKMIKINEEYRNLYSYNKRTQCLAMIICKNKYCGFNNIYKVMFNYERLYSSIYKIRYKTCYLCKKKDNYTETKYVAKLSKNY